MALALILTGSLNAENSKPSQNILDGTNIGYIHSQGWLASYDPFESEFRDLLGKSSTASALTPEDLNSTILDIMDASHIPGLQACIIYRDSVVWTGEYGYMDADLTIPVTDSTLFLQASISKTVITTALLQCVENGQVDLDADVSDYLPFPVSNWSRPSIPITCRMILSHVSTIGKNDGAYIPDMIFGADWTGDLSQYLEDYLVPGGPTYATTNYFMIDPGTYYRYSNYAFSLLALVVEDVTGSDFESYVQEAVFAPLNMNDASWFLANLDTNNIAMPIDYSANYRVGDYPRSVFTSDLDGDNDDDLMVANNLSDDVSILLGNGDGTFEAAVNYTAGDGPSSVFSSDLNGDTDNDLVIANSDSDDISILLGNGDGTFAAAVNYGVGSAPQSVFSCHLDGDGHNDLAVANEGTNDVSILLGNGDGTFAAAVNYGAGDGPHSVFCCNLDSDTDYDLAVVNRLSHNVSILLNDGDGTFQAAVNYGVGGYPWSVFSCDLDGDNDNDLAVANSTSDNVSILLNNGNGTFQGAVNYTAGDWPSSVYSSDLDGDNDNDLAVSNVSSNDVSILLNNGNGTFQAAVSYGAGYGPYSVSCSDLDGDNDNDLAVANCWSDDVSVFLNNGDGTMREYVALGHVSHPLWPIGLLKTSASQLANHLATIPTYGVFKGERLLESESVEQIMTSHYPSVPIEGKEEQGLGWYSLIINSHLVWGHAGGLPGCLSLMFVNPVTGNGAILLSNVYLNAGHYTIFDLLMAFSEDIDEDGIAIAIDNCPITYNPAQTDTDDDGSGDACDCCLWRVGDVNGLGGDEPTIGDVSTMIDALFIGGDPAVIACLAEADINQSGGIVPQASDITIGDISTLIDYLFITGPSLGLADCL